jgi:hypothetical protein
MKTPTLLSGIVLSWILSLPFSAVSQENPQSAKMQGFHHEVPDMPYMPPAANRKTSPPAVYKTTGFTMVQANVDANGQNIIGDAANEPSLAIDPSNPQNIVIGWRQFDNVLSNFRQAGYAYSTDGGLSFTFPGVINPGIFRSDPVLDADSAGEIFYNSLTANGNLYTTKVYKSINGGASWDDGVDAHGGDKQWMVIDRSGGVGSGNAYSTWNSYFSSCLPGFFTRSTDGGASFSNCVIVAGSPYWGTMAVGNNGELYITGTGDGYGIIVSKSDNVKYKDSLVSWQPVYPVDLDGSLTMGLLINPVGITGQANISVDQSNGPGRDNVYVEASVMRYSTGDSADIMFARSTNGGVTWDPPVRINDDPGNSAYQFFGTMSVAPNGRIDVVWLDTRNAPSDSLLSALFYSYSLDQGQTWSVNQQLSPQFSSRIGWPNQPKMGDYFHMISDENNAYLAWANTLNGEQDVYFSVITPNISGIAGQGTMQQEIRLSVFPNPAHDKATLRYELPGGNFTTVSLLDVTGRDLRTLVSGYREAGAHAIEVPVSGLKQGYYMLRVTSGGVSKTTGVAVTQ